MLFYKQLREDIVRLGSDNLLSIKEMYLNHQKVKLFTNNDLVEYQKKIVELHSSVNMYFYSSVQDFWTQLDRNTEEYSKEMAEIFKQGTVENIKDLEKNIKSNFTNPFKFFENLNNSFFKSNSTFYKLSDRNFENFKLLIEKVNDLMKKFIEDCEGVLSSFELKGKAS